MRRRTEAVRMGHVEEVLEQLGDAEPGDAAHPHRERLREVRHDGLPAEARDAELGVEREWAVVEDPLAPATLKLLKAAFAYVDSLPKAAPKKKKK